MKRLKGQVVSYDLFIAIFIFLLLLGGTLSIWQRNSELNKRQEIILEMKKDSITTLDVLVSSPGQPNNWTKDNAEIIGLVREKNAMDQEKINSFNNMDYYYAKEVMHLNEYEYYITITKLGSKVFEKGLKLNKSYSISSRRIIEYESEPATITLTLYK